MISTCRNSCSALRKKRSTERGISLLEVVVAIAVAFVLLFSISEVATLSLRVLADKKREYRAVLYLSEGAEAIRAMRDESWDAKIAPLSASTTYYLVATVNSWNVANADPGKLDGTFTRTLVPQNVWRDGADAIAPSGTLDPATKRFTVTVSWESGLGSRAISSDFYLTNYLAN